MCGLYTETVGEASAAVIWVAVIGLKAAGRPRLTPQAPCDTFCASSATLFTAESHGQKSAEHHG